MISLVETLLLEKELELKQLQDARLNDIVDSFEFEDNTKFKLIDDLIHCKGLDCPRFVVPESMVTNIMKIYYDEMVHSGKKPSKEF